MSGRVARLFAESDGWTHVMNRISCGLEEFPLEEKSSMGCIALKEDIEFYAYAYECEVATYVIMGNHYHLLCRMLDFKELSRSELQDKAKLFYPKTWAQTDLWTDAQWVRFNCRIYDISEFVKSFQMSFSKWYNKAFKRRGRVWADRFKTTVVYGEKALQETMMYIDLNPVRAGLVSRPEDYRFSSYTDRFRGKKKVPFMALNEILYKGNEREVFREYRKNLYLRGGVPSKKSDAVIEDQYIDMVVDGKSESVPNLRYKVKYLIEGLVLGSEKTVRDKIDDWRNLGYYHRRKNPIPTPLSGLFILRPQRE